MIPILKALASLKLAIVCLVFGFIVVLIGTVAQTSVGLYGALSDYFYTFFVYYTFENTDISIPYLPGGYLVGYTLLINLIAAFIIKFKYSQRKHGILLIHLGVIILLFGELIASVARYESSMSINEGESKSFSESILRSELVIIDLDSNSEYDRVYAIPQEMLDRNQAIDHPELPFIISIDDYYENSDVDIKEGLRPQLNDIESQGLRPFYNVEKLAKDGTLDAMNNPVVQVTIFDRNNNVLGEWLLPYFFKFHPPFAEPFLRFAPSQNIEYRGKSYAIQLRPERTYYPFSLTLVDFSFDRYPGSNIPRNFSSDVIVDNRETNQNFEYKIYMNHPLRHSDHTFYQHKFNAQTERTTHLQVVKNPGSIFPYVACTIITLGMCYQFLYSLVIHLRRVRRSNEAISS